jgi:hypothetical protein
MTSTTGGFAFYTNSGDQYGLAIYSKGDFLGKPEEAFLTAGSVYLNGKNYSNSEYYSGDSPGSACGCTSTTSSSNSC